MSSFVFRLRRFYAHFCFASVLQTASFTQIWNLEPHMRAMLEEDKHWVAANARYLAKVALEGYRGALEAA